MGSARRGGRWGSRPSRRRPPTPRPRRSRPPSADPAGLGFWANHPETWTAEIRARVQATDQRLDGADGTTRDGRLSPAEVTAAYAVSRGQTGNLGMQLLSTYLNLATRRINAGTAIESRTAAQLGLATVRAAAIYAADTLPLPFGPSTSDRYSNPHARPRRDQHQPQRALLGRFGYGT